MTTATMTLLPKREKLILKGKLRTPEGSKLYRRWRYDEEGVKVYASPYWYWKHKGKQHCTEQTDEQAALGWVRQYLLVHGRRDLSRPITWGECETLLMAKWRVDSRDEMIRKSKGIFVRIRAGFGGDFKLENITPIHVTDFKAKRMAAGLSNDTINFDLLVLRRAFTLAHDAERVGRIPKIELLPANEHRTGVVSKEEWAEIQKHARQPWLAVLQFLRGTGWRLNEGLRLTWNRVHLGPNGEGSWVELLAGRGIQGSKTGKARRLGISKDIHDLIARQPRRKGDPFVFGCSDYPGKFGQQRDPSSLQREWQRACKLAGCEGRIIHDLRRALITDMHAAGIPESVVRSIVGHESKFIHRLYIQTAGDIQAQALALVQQARASSAKPVLVVTERA